MPDPQPTTGRKRVRLADVFREPDEVELASGRIAEVRPLDAIGYDMYLELEAQSGSNPRKIWEIVARCLPSVPPGEVDSLTVPECMTVIAIAVGRIEMVQQLAGEMEGKGSAPTVAAPEHQRSATPSDSSSSELPGS